MMVTTYKLFVLPCFPAGVLVVSFELFPLLLSEAGEGARVAAADEQ